MESAEDTREETLDLPPARQGLWQAYPRLRRFAVVATIIVVAVFAYVMLLTRFDVLERPAEQYFGVARGEARVGVYIQPTVVDAVNESIQIRVNVTGTGASAIAPGKDLVLHVRRGAETENIVISSSQPRPEETFSFDLGDGSVHDYPLDDFKTQIALSCVEAGSDTALPIRVTSWEGIIGYTVRASPVVGSPPNEVRLRLDVRRTGAIRLFGIAAYGAMVVMAFSALTIGTLVFLGIRKIEVTLVGAVGAIVFALPALRNALPGTPPLGVSADILVFFWAELGAVAALALFVTAWAGRGPPP
jgi:hypothetical protein